MEKLGKDPPDFEDLILILLAIRLAYLSYHPLIIVPELRLVIPISCG